MEFIHRWIEKSPLSAAMGVELVSVDSERARLALPYLEANSNPGKALHGGCAATLGAIGGQVLARASLGEEAGPFHTVALQVNYLAAAINEPIVAEATLLRRGKELCFGEVEVATEDGKSIAHITTSVRGRFGAEPSELAISAGDHGESDPGAMGPHLSSMPFIGSRGISCEHMTGGTSRLVMPFLESNADENGGVHEGAVLALMDTTGAMASWAETGPGRFKASTPSMQARILTHPRKDDLIGYGTMVQRDNEIFWSDVDVVSAADARIVARGTVVYRILT
jgi:uncharacterized protein (TIGR00369 family)